MKIGYYSYSFDSESLQCDKWIQVCRSSTTQTINLGTLDRDLVSKSSLKYSDGSPVIK